eukprot:TRINITY_DN40012_c0_g1_i1.p1 TRINITY_DN40012_c0_g1~~TRINITY_DN40012_c0_g1_i1.p1  ORF type:complete len:1044 (+),score=153.60 TRINITY_DN40012_c0_g1_i1:353-3133(+)
MSACEPGWLLYRLVALLSEFLKMQDLPVLSALETLNSQISPTCTSVVELYAGGAAARPWTSAVLGVLQRLSVELHVRGQTLGQHDDKFPLRPCYGKVRYHDAGSESLFEFASLAYPTEVIALHRPVGFLQLSHVRCCLGVATSAASMARSFVQLADAVGASSVPASALSIWARSEARAIVGICIAYARFGGRTWDAVASDWAPLFVLLHDLFERGIFFPDSVLKVAVPPPVSPRSDGVWYVAQPTSVDVGLLEVWPARPWDDAVSCTSVWLESPDLVDLVGALAVFSNVRAGGDNAKQESGSLLGGSRRADLPERLLRSAALISDLAASRCELAEVTRRLAAAALPPPSDAPSGSAGGAAEAVCWGALENEWDTLRMLTMDDLSDPRFAYWAVLVFGLLDYLGAKARGHAACIDARVWQSCHPAELSRGFLAQLHLAIEHNAAASPASAVAFLARSSSECSSGLAAANLVLAESLLVLALGAEKPIGAFFAATPAAPSGATATGPSTGDTILGSEIDGDSSTDAIEAALIRVMLRGRGQDRSDGQNDALTPWLPTPLPRVLGPSPRRFLLGARNVSDLSRSLINDDVRLFADSAWVMIAGERIETVLAGDWPITTLLLRISLRLAALSSWRPLLATKRKQPTNRPSSAGTDNAAKGTKRHVVDSTLKPSPAVPKEGHAPLKVSAPLPKKEPQGEPISIALAEAQAAPPPPLSTPPASSPPPPLSPPPAKAQAAPPSPRSLFPAPWPPPSPLLAEAQVAQPPSPLTLPAASPPPLLPQALDGAQAPGGHAGGSFVRGSSEPAVVEAVTALASTSVTTSEVAMEERLRGGSGSSSALATKASLTTLDAVEKLLEEAGEEDLADHLMVVVSREGVSSEVLRSVSWLYRQHFFDDVQPRPSKSVEKFLRRLRLLFSDTRLSSGLILQPQA